MRDFVDFSQELARASGEIIMRYFRSGVAVETKVDESPVTIADREAEEVMREMIMKAYPGPRHHRRGIREPQRRR